MSADRAAAWIYRGLWRGLVTRFRVPEDPPQLPTGAAVEALKPAPGYLAYLKCWFWLALVASDGLLLLGWVALAAFDLRWAAATAIPALAVAVLPDIVAYVAIHLRFDTTWYLLTDRSTRPCAAISTRSSARSWCVSYFPGMRT